MPVLVFWSKSPRIGQGQQPEQIISLWLSSRTNHHLSGVRPGAGQAGDRDGAEGDDPPAQVIQDELVVRGRAAVRGVQVAREQAQPHGRGARRVRPEAYSEVLDRRAVAVGRL